MREVLKNIKVSEIPNLIAQLGLSPEQEVNLTIEESSRTQVVEGLWDELVRPLERPVDKSTNISPSESLLSIMDRVGKKAQEKGLTEDKLAELLADES